QGRAARRACASTIRGGRAPSAENLPCAGRPRLTAMAVAEHRRTDACEHDHPAPARWSSLPSWTPPLLVGVLGLAACVLLAVRDPNAPGSYGFCPSRALFGIDCPGCGLMRGTHALVT